jgi:hypothetical protein
LNSKVTSIKPPISIQVCILKTIHFKISTIDHVELIPSIRVILSVSMSVRSFLITLRKVNLSYTYVCASVFQRQVYIPVDLAAPLSSKY